MAQVNLSEDDLKLLCEVLDEVAANLSPEIADTDNPAYRRQLRDRRDHIIALRSAVSGPQPNPG